MSNGNSFAAGPAGELPTLRGLPWFLRTVIWRDRTGIRR